MLERPAPVVIRHARSRTHGEHRPAAHLVKLLQPASRKARLRR
jgi:hypothetical protein